jgi:hypothetical protein
MCGGTLVGSREGVRGWLDRTDRMSGLAPAVRVVTRIDRPFA